MKAANSLLETSHTAVSQISDSPRPRRRRSLASTAPAVFQRRSPSRTPRDRQGETAVMLSRGHDERSALACAVCFSAEKRTAYVHASATIYCFEGEYPCFVCPCMHHIAAAAHHRTREKQTKTAGEELPMRVELPLRLFCGDSVRRTLDAPAMPEAP